MFARGTERWGAEVGNSRLSLGYDSLTQSISVTAPERENVYFVAPGEK